MAKATNQPAPREAEAVEVEAEVAAARMRPLEGPCQKPIAQDKLVRNTLMLGPSERPNVTCIHLSGWWEVCAGWLDQTRRRDEQ
jgi:hypothetical protein